MVEDMDIIISGKPLALSYRCTTGTDISLAKKIMTGIDSIAPEGTEVLVVDILNWNGIWVSVYTFRFGGNVVTDKAKRPSHFAISLVMPQRYCRLVSQVYRLLENVVKDNVIGTYLGNDYRYIVNDFEDSAAFEKLCSNLKSNYKNLENAFDNSFKMQTTFSNYSYCSVQDCDSLAFVDSLKNKGGIIVSEKAVTKDLLAAQSEQYRNEAQKATGNLQAEKTKVAELTDSIKKMQKAAEQANGNASGKIQELNRKVKSLEKENGRLLQEKENVQEKLQELSATVTQATYIFEALKQPTGRNQEKPDKPTGCGLSKTKKRGFASYLPIVNTMLILFLVVGLFLNLKGCSDSSNEVQKDEDTAVQIEVNSLNDQLIQIEGEINRLQENNVQLEQTLELYKKSLENSVGKPQSQKPTRNVSKQKQSQPNQKNEGKGQEKTETPKK